MIIIPNPHHHQRLLYCSCTTYCSLGRQDWLLYFFLLLSSTRTINLLCSGFSKPAERSVFRMKRHVTMSATNEPRQNFSSKEEMIGVGDYLKLRSFDSSNEYIAYRTTTTVSHNNSRNLGGVIYCNGFRSVMTGNKARRLEEFCVHYNISFTRFDYRGHGQS